jgi:hypothetical protein
MDPGLRLLASRWFLAPFALLSVVGTIALAYVLITGYELSTTNVLRMGVMLLLSYMAIGLSLEARRSMQLN